MLPPLAIFLRHAIDLFHYFADYFAAFAIALLRRHSPLFRHAIIITAAYTPFSLTIISMPFSFATPLR